LRLESLSAIYGHRFYSMQRKQPFVAWGDSLTAGTGSSLFHDFPTLISGIDSRMVFNEGKGGETSSEIKKRFLAYHNREIFGNSIFWVGRNNFYENNVVIDDIDQMVSSLPKNGHYLILGIVNSDVPEERKNTSNLNSIKAINMLLSEKFKDKFIPIREILISSASPSDKIDVENDVIPHTLRSDKIHLNDDGYAIVAYAIEISLRAHGW